MLFLSYIIFYCLLELMRILRKWRTRRFTDSRRWGLQCQLLSIPIKRIRGKFSIRSRLGDHRHLVQIFGITSRGRVTPEENARLTRDETRDCRWPTNAEGIMGFIFPSGILILLCRGYEASDSLSSLVSLGFLRDEPEDGRSVFTLISMTDLVIYGEQSSRVLFFLPAFYRLVVCISSIYIYILHLHSIGITDSLLQIVSYIAAYLSSHYLRFDRVTTSAQCKMYTPEVCILYYTKSSESNATNGTSRARKVM